MTTPIFRHNHSDWSLAPYSTCPACDQIHDQQRPRTLTLTSLVGTDQTSVAGQALFALDCVVCGRISAHGTVQAPLAQAVLYQQRHLAEHLAALATEISRSTR